MGMTIDIGSLGNRLRYDKKLFSESTGFVVEVTPSKLDAFLSLSEKSRVRAFRLGRVTVEPVFVVSDGESRLVEVPVGEMKARWDKGLEYALA